MSAFHDIILAGAAGQQGYKISRSVRLRSSASAYFNRTFASAGNQQKMTFSYWVKRGALGAKGLYTSGWSGGGATQGGAFINTGGDSIEVSQQTNNAFDFRVVTTAVYRDPSAWYHIVIAIDTTQATAANRVIVYVNGVQVTSYSTASYPSQNLTTKYNGTAQRLFANDDTGNPYITFDGYGAESRFIDGQALTPSSFGEFDAVTGVWKPKKYTGTYGTNGWYLDFSDNSAATAAAIGKDSSGNGNNWTPNNISVTAGVTYDSMTDVPTMYADGGNGLGNYCVINPLASISVTTSNANLTVATAVSGTSYALGTIGIPTSGKWYWEYTPTSSGNESFCGVMTSSTSLILAYYGATGIKWVNGASSAYGATYTTNDVMGVAVDVDGGTVTFYKNNTSQGAITYSVTADTFFPYFADGSSSAATTFQVNFGQRPFAYTPPTGFKALNTQNLPDSTITNGAKYMAATLYTGNAGTNAITNTINGASFQPDLVWVKNRASAYSHGLYDSVRGAGNTKGLYSNETSAEGANSTLQNLVSFDASGFTLGATSSTNVINTSGQALVGWQWKANGSAVSNTAGSITSQVNAGVTQGFSVVTFTNPSSGSGSIGHGLGVKPAMIIVKARSNTSNWTTAHKSLGAMASTWINLDSTAAAQTSSNIWGGEPTSTVFYCGTGIQVASATMVAYCFAAVKGYSAFGSYTGNGSADGPFVYCGFRPRWVLVKRSDSIGDWNLHDTSRDTYNVADKSLFPNASNAETTPYYMDILSNGFKIKDSGSSMNTSSGTYIYAAFAENPFKNSLAR